MGCCKSLLNIGSSRFHSNNSTRASSALSQAEMTQLETLLSGIPDHCREAIINLPARQLLNLYQYHTIALYHGLQREWQIVILYELDVIKGFQALLPMNKDHYIFLNFYSILSASFLALGELQAAIEGIHSALVILLKHTPTDYTTISNHYCYLAEAYKAKQNWESTAEYLTKAIDTPQLKNDLDQEYIRTLETELQMANFDSAELERLFDKQSELQVTDDILKDVLKHLETHITSSFICNNDVAQFIAAQFKNVQMKTSLLSIAVIEAALTIIIDRLNDKNTADDPLYTTLKQASISFTYTHESEFYAKGVRVFKVERKKN